MTFPTANVLIFFAIAKKIVIYSPKAQICPDLKSDAVEDERKDVVYLGEFPDPAGTDEEDGHRASAFCLILGHYLTAGAAWGRRVLADLSVLAGHDRYVRDRIVRVSGCRIEHCGPFCACAGRICRILLIGAFDDEAIVKTYCGSHIELRIWSI